MRNEKIIGRISILTFFALVLLLLSASPAVFTSAFAATIPSSSISRGMPNLPSSSADNVNGIPPSSATATTWAKAYGGSGNDLAEAVQQTKDGGYIVIGRTASFGAGAGDGWVLKLDSSGNVVWQKTYGGTSFDDLSSVAQTSDGGYVLAGRTGSFGAGSLDAWVLKINSTGSVIWQKTFGGSASDAASSVQQTSDGGYIVSGSTRSFGNGLDDAWVLKLDSSGGLLWQKTFGGSGDDAANSITQTPDGGYVTAGVIGNSSTKFCNFSVLGFCHAWVFKLNSSGNVIWQKTYGGNGMEFALSVQNTTDGGYIVGGVTSSFGAGGKDAWIFKLNSSGSIMWQNAYGGKGFDAVKSIRQTPDGGYVATGNTSSFGSGAYDAWLLKLNSTGSVSFQRTYGGSGNDYAFSVQATSDGGYVFAGSTSSFTSGGTDAFVVKLSKTGSTCIPSSKSSAKTTSTSALTTTSSATSTTTSVSAVNSATSVTTTAVTPMGDCHWAATYGSKGTEFANSIEQTNDGGYIVAGGTNSSGAGAFDLWVLKLDQSGSVSWQETLGGTSVDVAQSVEQTADGGYIVAGYTNSFGAGGYDAWVLKLSSNGKVIWQKTYGGSGTDLANSINQTTDGGYIVGGETNSFGAGGFDFWVLKLDSSGNVLWQKTYGGSGDDIGNSVRQTSDGGYIVAGYTGGGGGADVWVIKLYGNGTTAWQKTYGGPSEDIAYSIQQTKDGGYVVAGFTNSFGAGGDDAWVLKLDASGTIQWQKAHGGTMNDIAYSIQQTLDGGYVVSGVTNSFGTGSGDAWVFKLSSSGNVTWQKTFGGAKDDEFFSVEQTKNGGYVAAGETSSFGAGKYDLWLLNLDSSGNIKGCSFEKTSSATVTISLGSTGTTSVTGSTTSSSIGATTVTPKSTKATVVVDCI